MIERKLSKGEDKLNDIFLLLKHVYPVAFSVLVKDENLPMKFLSRF